jgi:hypothetical protein
LLTIAWLFFVISSRKDDVERKTTATGTTLPVILVILASLAISKIPAFRATEGGASLEPFSL